ncbi:MAG: VOC family protein [Dehalococcoidia bacterium]
MAKPIRVGHLVLNVKNLEESTRFYTEVLGFQVSRQRETGTFLTCGKIHHDVALFQAPEGALPVTEGQLGLNHFAVQVANFEDLQEAYREFTEKGVTMHHNTDHGMTSSIYFMDPDGNRIKYFCNNQEDTAEGLRLMGDESRQNKELVIS